MPVIAENIWRRNFLPRLKTVGLEWAAFLVMRRTHASLMRDLGVDPSWWRANSGIRSTSALNALRQKREALALAENL